MSQNTPQRRHEITFYASSCTSFLKSCNKGYQRTASDIDLTSVAKHVRRDSRYLKQIYVYVLKLYLGMNVNVNE